ncbi:MAG: prepilin peptidase [Patescibacteria group bacterium]
MLFLFILGLCIGSFLNVLIWRLNDEKAPKFWQGRSICPKCKHSLAWKDNIPLLSFILLNGRCRYCHKKISLQYPLVELLTAVVTVLLATNFISLLTAYCFIVIFFSDWIYGLIPDEATLILLIVGIFLNWNNWLIGLLALLVLLSVFLVTRGRGIGFGDVKLIFPLGLLLGWPKILVMFYAASIMGGGYALFLLVLHRKKFGDTIALGPFLIIGTVAALCIKDSLLSNLWWLFP